MKKLIPIFFIILLLASCGTTKDMRRSNRAAKKLERLVDRFPELKRTDTIATPVSIKTPEVSGTIIQPFFMPAEKEIIKLPGTAIFTYPDVTEMEPFDIPFSDPHLYAVFHYDGIDFSLDYTIHSMRVDTIIKTEVKTIQPVVYEDKPMTKLKWILAILLGVVFGIVIMKITH